jgi:hypothetical protein
VSGDDLDDALDPAPDGPAADGAGGAAAFLAAPAAGTCRNCGAAVPGRYCGECGQRRDLRPLSLFALVWELLVEVLDSDARVWRTLRTLTLRPGRLTLAWADGRRARYMPPFRLYLVLNVLAFLVMSAQVDLDPALADARSDREDARTELRRQIDALEGETGPGVSEQRAALERALAMLGPEAAPAAEDADAGRPLDAAIDRLERRIAEAEADGEDVARRSALRDELAALRARRDDADVATPAAPEAAAEAEDRVNVTIGGTDAALELGGFDDWLVGLGYPRERVEAALQRMVEDPARALQALRDRLPMLMVLLLPLVATVWRGLYLFSGRPWVVHLVGLVHLHAFVFLALLFADGMGGFGLLLATLGVPLAPDALGSLAGGLVALALPVYTALWLRALYGHGWPVAVGMTGVLGVLHLIGALLGLVAIVLATLTLEVIFGS